MIICGTCGEEVRRGWRHGLEGFWHREDVDHQPILGQRYMTRERDEAAMLDPRVAEDGSIYSAAEFDIRRDPDVDRRRRRLAALNGEDPDYVEPVPEPEVWAHDITPEDLPPRSGTRQVLNLLRKNDWEVLRLTRSRGPYLGSKGEVLSISDSVLVVGLDRQVDGKVRSVVASWRDGGFDFAYIGLIEKGKLSPDRVGFNDLKKWIKGMTA